MATMKKSAKKYAMGGTVTTETTKKPVAKVVEKKTTVTVKKPKTASQRIGDLTLRDVKNSAEDALNLSTLGGYGVAKKKVKELTGMKSGGKMKKAKSGASIKKAQMGKVIETVPSSVKPMAKNGKSMKKCAYGCK